jgi:hypothetical protein
MSARRRRKQSAPPQSVLRDHLDRGLMVFLLAFALVLGGASRGAFMAHGVLEVTFAAVLLGIVVLRRDSQFDRAAWALLAIGLAFFAYGLASLAPLPAAIWTSLPGRAPIAEGFALVGAAAPSLPISLTPEATLASLSGFLPPIAAFCFAAGMICARGGQTLGWTLPALAAGSLLLGIAQVFGGQSSPLYVYEFQNRGAPTGFFANVNHQATLGLMALPFLGALAGLARLRAVINQVEYGKLLLIAGMALFSVTLVVFAGSVAGLLMLGPTLIASYLIAFGMGKLRSWRTVIAFGVILGIAAVAYGVGTHPAVQAELGATLDDGPGSRMSAIDGGGAAAAAFFPVGSGLGSFMTVFSAFEAPAPTSTTFMAHAHNEYLELAIELGLVGVLILAAVLIWFARMGATAWGGAPGSDTRYRQAAWTALAVVAVHSLADYPLRTPAIAVIAAMCAGILAAPAMYRRQATEADEAAEADAPKHVDL